MGEKHPLDEYVEKLRPPQSRIERWVDEHPKFVEAALIALGLIALVLFFACALMGGVKR